MKHYHTLEIDIKNLDDMIIIKGPKVLLESTYVFQIFIVVHIFEAHGL